MITTPASISTVGYIYPRGVLDLTLREQEVLILIAHEYTTSMIAQKLYVSHHTILSHRKNMKKKLRVSNVAGLVRRGFEIGLLKLEK